MATNTRGNAGQQYITNQVHHLVRTVTFRTLGVTAGAKATVTVGELPPRAIILRGATWVVTGFNDTTADDLDIGVVGGDDDLFASAVDLNSSGVLTAFDDLADANRYSATARKVTCTYDAAATGDGTTGEAVVIVEYVIAPSPPAV